MLLHKEVDPFCDTVAIPFYHALLVYHLFFALSSIFLNFFKFFSSLLSVLLFFICLSRFIAFYPQHYIIVYYTK